MTTPSPDERSSRAITLTVAAALFMETLDGTIIATALPAMATDFHATTLDTSLGITAYMIAMAVFVPASGWCAERYGARRVFAAAVALFTLASLACGLSPGLWSFVAARIVQGAAAAFMSPVGRLVVLRETPKHRLIEAMGTVTWPGLIAPVVGPALGGFIVTHASWHWCFLLNVPLGLLGIWLVLRHIPHRPAQGHAPLDRLGFVLNAIALSAIVQALTELGQRQDQLAWPLGLLALGIAAALAAVWHARRARAPMLDLRALSIFTFRLCSLSSGFISRIAISAGPFLLPLMFQIGFGMSPLESGLMVLVYMAGNLAMKSVTTPILRRHGFRKVLVLNSALCALCLFACGSFSPDDSRLWIYAWLLAAGMTRSMNFTTISTLAFADVPDAQRAGASGLATMLNQVAMTMGVAFAAFALGSAQSLRGAGALALADFRWAWFAVGALMVISTFSSMRLARDAGAAVSQAH